MKPITENIIEESAIKNSIVNFERDIREYIEGEFGYFGVNYNPSSDLDRDLLNLFTIQRKYVYPFPREVNFSKELLEKMRHSNHKRDIMHLKLLFINGGNVNPFQSTKLFNYKVHDQLVYAWSIYHFHLSTSKTKHQYFNDRTKQVLFVYISKEQALFLEIDRHPPHDIFADKKLLEIIDNNWKGILSEPNGVLGLSHNIKNSERYKMRKRGVNEAMVEVNGKIFFCPGLGNTTSGDSSQEVQKLLYFNKWIKQNTEKINSSRAILDKYFINQHRLKNTIEYKLVFTNEGPQIWDFKSEICLIKYKDVINI